MIFTVDTEEGGRRGEKREETEDTWEGRKETRKRIIGKTKDEA